jgi:hypothetical protein
MKFQADKILLILVLSISLYLPGVSQKIDVVASNPDINPPATTVHKFIGHDKENYYVLKFHNYQYFLEKLDKNLNILFKEPIKLLNGIKTYDLETVVCFYGELYIFVSKSRLNNITLYYQKIDKSNLKPSSELLELTTIECLKGNWADFNFALSKHEKRLLVACRMKMQFTKVQFNEYYVFGEDLKLLWKRKDSFGFKRQGPRDNKYVVDELGNISVLSLQKRETVLSIFTDEKNSFTIYRYTNEGKDFKEIPVSIPNKYIRGIDIIGDEKGELICAGFYSELLRAGLSGTFFFRIDLSYGKMYNSTVNEFDEGLMAKLAATHEPLINKHEVVDYEMTDILLRANGTILIIAEQFFAQVHDTYNNLILVNYMPSGEIYWDQVVEKKQNYDISLISSPEIDPSEYREHIMETGALDQATNSCSYALMAPLDGNSIIIFYNDDIRNLDHPEKKINFKNPRKAYLLAVTVDEFGKITKQPVLKWKKREFVPEPIRYYDLLNNCIVIPAFRYRKFVYYKFTAGI